jgi:tetratricopeptide (TPR) repeat protein
MTKAAFLTLGLAALVLIPVTVSAQDNPAATAVNEAVMRQANTIVLRQKLTDAKAVAQRGDIMNAAKLYQESVTLAEQIGSGIDTETQQAVAGLTFTRMALARDAQSRGDLREADAQVKQVLNADPKNGAAITFKQRNDQMLAAMKGRMPDDATLAEVPQISSQKTASGTLLQDGKLLYEMGKYSEAEIKLTQATQLDPDNSGAFYYLNLIKQAKYARDAIQHTTDTQERMEHVEKQWILPTPSANVPSIGNPYATNTFIYTGPGRQAIVAKLDHLHLDNVSYDGLPLNEVLRQLTELSKARDPERKGINFLINNNPDLSGYPGGGPGGAATGPGAVGAGAAGFVGGGRGAGAPQLLDPNTGLPAAPAADAGGAAAGEAPDVGSYIVKIPSLTDVRLADVLDAIVLVADHPIKYSIEDFAVVFSSKNPQGEHLFMRTFRVDPNTFYSGLESVYAQSFASVQNNGTSGGSGGGGGGSSQNQQSVAYGIVNAFGGQSQARTSGGQGGGGGGAATGGNRAGAGGAGGGNAAIIDPLDAGEGLNGVSIVTHSATFSMQVVQFFGALGINWQNPPGKAVFFNDRLGYLFVKSTESDLDTIERAIQVLNQVPPQVHIKARFIEVSQTDNNQLGFDWTLGQFNLGNQVVGQGGNPGSLTVPVSAANPLGAFPGATAANTIADQGQQLFSSGLSSSTAGSTTATITGILTNPNFQVVLHALQSRTGVENLGEPEATTISGRQTQMRATSIITVVTGLNYQQGTAATTTGTTGSTSTGQ